MMGGRSWQGNWKARLHERVREHGYSSLTAFAEAHPTLPLYALAAELGGDELNAVQVLGGLVEEAVRSQQFTRLMRGQLVREFSESLAGGWPAALEGEARLAVAATFASWIGFTPETHKERARQLWAALLTTPPPPGWRPLSPNDELLRTLLPDEEA